MQALSEPAGTVSKHVPTVPTQGRSIFIFNIMYDQFKIPTQGQSIFIVVKVEDHFYKKNFYKS